MRLWPLKWMTLVFVLAVAQTVWADFLLSRFVDNLQSRGMILYYAAWVVLLAIPLLNRYLRVVAVYILLFLLARGFSRITDEQDPIRTLYSVLPGLSMGLKIVAPLVVVALLVKALEWVLHSMNLFSKRVTPEEVTDAFNDCLKARKPPAEFRKRLEAMNLKPEETRAWLRKYEERLAAGNGLEETI